MTPKQNSKRPFLLTNSQPGEYTYLLMIKNDFRVDPDVETTTAHIHGAPRSVNRLPVGPACAFTLFYATGWPRCSLAYRIVEREGAEVRV